jgi:hypothetical protein
MADLPRHLEQPDGADGTLERCAWVTVRAGFYGVEQARQFELYRQKEGLGVNKAAEAIQAHLTEHAIILGVCRVKQLLKLGRFYLEMWSVLASAFILQLTLECAQCRPNVPERPCARG